MKPVSLFNNQSVLECENCGKDLFENPSMSIVVFDKKEDVISNIHTCCKGECDRVLKAEKRSEGYTDGGWKDITDFMNPILYLKQIMAMMNSMQSQFTLTDDAMEKYKDILLATAPYVMREPAEKEKETAISDSMYSF